MNMPCNYAKERVAFGEPIAHRQSIAFLLANMRIELEATRLMVWEAAYKLTATKTPSKAAYLAKQYADKMVLEVTDGAVQVLGGHGYVREHPVELWLRNGRGFATLGWGSDGVQIAGDRMKGESEHTPSMNLVILSSLHNFHWSDKWQLNSKPLKRLRSNCEQVRMVAENVMRPDSRRLDDNEHERPTRFVSVMLPQMQEMEKANIAAAKARGAAKKGNAVMAETVNGNGHGGVAVLEAAGADKWRGEGEAAQHRHALTRPHD